MATIRRRACYICRFLTKAASYCVKRAGALFFKERYACMIVTFCGHHDIFYGEKQERRLEEELRKVLQKSPDAVFYLGDYGSFDWLCNATLRQLQAEYPRLRRVFVTPYLDPGYTRFRYAREEYDEILYPFFTETVARRFAISARNRRMVDAADLVIAYVTHDWGGAAQTLRYATRKKKPCVNLGVAVSP